jgi:hypothetical protein
MSGYLDFERTGHKEVDEILWRIEQAGDGYHNTNQWSDSENGEPSYMDKINEAIRSAKVALNT